MEGPTYACNFCVVIGGCNRAIGSFPVLIEGGDLGDTGTADDDGISVLYSEEIGEGHTDPTPANVIILFYACDVATEPGELAVCIELGVLGHLLLTLEGEKLHSRKILSVQQDVHLSVHN